MNGNKKFLDFLNSFTEEDYADIRKEMEAQVQKEREFFHSQRCKEVIRQIKEELQIKPRVYDNPYTEILFGDVSNEEFNLLFDCIFDEQVSGLKPKNFAQEPDNYNEEFRVFDGLIFRMISGQGIGLDIYLDDSGFKTSETSFPEKNG